MMQETANENTVAVQLSTVAILGFEFGLYPIVVPLSFPRSNQLCFIVMLVETLLLNAHRPP